MKHFHRKIRKTHRYLGIIIGIQFLLWTIGGLYFSWTNIDDVHGDFEHKSPSFLPKNLNLISPTVPIQKISSKADSIVEIKLIQILGKPTYQIKYAMNHGGHLMNHVQLADAETGNLRDGITESEAKEMVQNNIVGNGKIENIQFIKEASSTHEYRNQPLPAYAITLSNGTTFYVATEIGQITKIRNNKWRIFDFLWMFHTMDFEGRDNINNWVLRAFSIFGLLTISSGFILFVVSSKWYQRKNRK